MLQVVTPTELQSPKPYRTSRLERYCLRLLTRVARQSGSVAINPQLLRAASTQLVLGQHAQDRLANHPVGLVLAHALRRHFLQSARVSAVRVVHLLLDLVARQLDLIR